MHPWDLSKSSDLRNNLSPEEVTACHSLLEPSSLATNSRDGAAWCQGRQQGGLWAGCPSGCSLGVICPPQSWAITDKTQTCPKAVLCLCPLGEPPAVPSSWKQPPSKIRLRQNCSGYTALSFTETQKTYYLHAFPGFKYNLHQEKHKLLVQKGCFRQPQQAQPDHNPFPAQGPAGSIHTRSQQPQLGAQGCLARKPNTALSHQRPPCHPSSRGLSPVRLIYIQREPGL